MRSSAPKNPDRHAEKMQKRKAAHARKMADKTREKGLLIVHTGTGKGKSTAAFGMVMRAIAHEMRVGVVQFIKGKWESGERTVLMRFPDLVTIHALGEGFTWETADRERDLAAAAAAWEQALAFLTDPDIAMVVLDELNIALRYDQLPLEDVLTGLKNRPPHQHVIVTGRNAKPELIALADLVTEMRLVKHPFREGIKAQPGVEY